MPHRVHPDETRARDGRVWRDAEGLCGGQGPAHRIRYVEFMDAIPKLPPGKILRRVLVQRERAGQRASRHDATDRPRTRREHERTVGTLPKQACPHARLEFLAIRL